MQIRVNVISKDQHLIEKIKYRFRERIDIDLKFSETPVAEENTEIYVAPVQYIDEITAKHLPENKGFPVMYYGSPSFLRRAFLSGCLDYLKEPWTIEEFELRLAKIINHIKTVYIFPWGEISLTSTEIATEKGNCTLTYQEYKILKHLIQQRGKVVPREVLFYTLWNNPGSKQSRAIDVHISSLRKKLRLIIPENYYNKVIVSIKGIGYMIK